jgi:cell wall-associated NlpC family hydrolase
LYNNYYTVNGYDEIPGTSTEIDFTYTEDNPVTQADLQAHDWSNLEVGDLIFLDFDKDFVWDNAAVYLGAYGNFTHAVVFASDYYDKVVIEDLDGVSWIITDIDYGYSDVRTPAYDVISGS